MVEKNDNINCGTSKVYVKNNKIWENICGVIIS